MRNTLTAILIALLIAVAAVHLLAPRDRAARRPSAGSVPETPRASGGAAPLTRGVQGKSFPLAGFGAEPRDTTKRSPDPIADAARTLLDAPDTAEPNRITALHILTQRDGPSILPRARRIAADPDRTILERMSAVAALGTHGTPDDIDQLEQIAQNPDADPRLQTAAAMNIPQKPSPKKTQNPR